MSEQEQLLEAVRLASAEVEGIRQKYKEIAQEARQRRATAIRAASDAGIDKELIVRSAGLKWPVSRQRWSELRKG